MAQVTINPPTIELITPTLVTPSPNKILDDGLPVFSWSSVANYYTVQVSTDSNFNAQSQLWENVDVTSNQVTWDSNFIANTTGGVTPTKLERGNTYYWRVIAMNEPSTQNPDIAVSSHGIFKVKELVTPELFSPANSEILSSGRPVFSWSGTANYYTVQVSTDSNFDAQSQLWENVDVTSNQVTWGSNFIANTTAGTTPSELERGLIYYWRVIAMDEYTAQNPDMVLSNIYHFKVQLLSNWSATSVFVGQAFTLMNSDVSIVKCLPTDNAISASIKVINGEAISFTPTSQSISNWRCLNSVGEVITEFVSPLTIKKLASPENLSVNTQSD